MIDIRKAVEKITPEITAMRNHIHEHPEQIGRAHV